jgi:hypothetical protein
MITNQADDIRRRNASIRRGSRGAQVVRTPALRLSLDNDATAAEPDLFD